MPLTDDELKKDGLVQFPTVIGGVVPVINVQGIQTRQLRLTGTVLADIYLGKITKWNDPAIVALNKDLKLPDAQIAVVRRADGSGTTFIFTNYLSKVSADWKSRVGEGTAVNWVVGMGGKGNEGVSAFVQRLPNSIGYVEYAFAKQNKQPYALLQNAAGNFVAPDDTTFAAAAAAAEWSKTFFQILTNQPGKDAWPITGATFIMMHERQDKPQQAAASLRFFDWAFRNGDKSATDLDYVPLPESVENVIRQQWARIRDAAGSRCSVRKSPRSGSSAPAASGGRAFVRPRFPPRCRMTPMAATVQAASLPEDTAMPAPQAPRPRVYGRTADIAFGIATRSAAILTLLLLVGIIASLFIEAWPSIRHNGVAFLWTAEWDPVQERFGGLIMIYGTLMTSLIALVIAVPVSFGIALFLTELSPKWLKRPLGTAIELLAAVPSIVYGMFGLLVFAPIFSQYFQVPLQQMFGGMPLVGSLFQGAPVGIGILPPASSWRS